MAAYHPRARQVGLVMSKRFHVAALAITAWTSIAGGVGAAGAVTPLSPELQVNTFTVGHQYRSRMSMTSTGDYVVTWTSPVKDGDGFGIVARRFASTGPALGGEFVVNSHTLDDQQFSAVSVNEA